ncbi:hypothetical protein EPO66_00450 [bacterium]|nr:MAG: hypothetical protein EPO66_00450 [bacterium]
MKIKFSTIILLAMVLSGCATIKDVPKGVAGISTKVLEDKRSSAITKNFNCDYNTGYAKIKEILIRTGSYIYSGNKQKRMIAIYVSEADTTPVGIFFNENGQTLDIQVSSPSTYAREYISSKIFASLEKSLKGIEEPVVEESVKKE